MSVTLCPSGDLGERSRVASVIVSDDVDLVTENGKLHLVATSMMVGQ